MITTFVIVGKVRAFGSNDEWIDGKPFQIVSVTAADAIKFYRQFQLDYRGLETKDVRVAS